MSDEKGPSRGSYSPVPTKISIDDYERLTKMFKDVFSEQPLIKYAIYAAGVAGVLDSAHVVWQFFKFVTQALTQKPAG